MATWCTITCNMAAPLGSSVRRLSLVVPLLALAAVPIAYASPITFTFQGTASGTVGGVNFYNAWFTIIQSSDTSLMSTSFNGFATAFQTPYATGASIDIGGFGAGIIITPTYIADVQQPSNSFAAIAISTGGDVGGNSTIFNNYTLQSGVGPVLTTTNPFIDGFTVSSTLGTISFAVLTGVTFTARLPAVGPPTVPPGDLYCAAGVNGSGNIYDPTISYCASGAVVPDGDLYCAAGANGPGYIYLPATSACASGAVVPTGYSFCPAGVYGSGGIYDSSMGEGCYQGVVLPTGDSFCPPGANGPGGLYNPSNGEGCNNGVSSPLGSLPPAISPMVVSAIASGLTYSRASQTFNGSVTITNNGNSLIKGPLQIVLSGLPANVTLLNATSSLSGTPYLTVLVASLASGQSATVSLQFRNPSNAAIQFTPVVYSGNI
jgi:hypothetical protein